MRRILLPTDFSENAFNAIRYAVNLYANTECHFILLHTLYNADYIMYSSLGGVYKEKSTEGLERTKKRVEEEFSNELHEFEVISSFEMLHQEIRKRVEQRSVDLIIMGTNGAAGGEELLFGTTTVHAIKTAKCPLLAIPAGEKFKRPKNITFATKYEIDFSEYQMDLIKLIAESFDSSVHALHADNGKTLNENQKNSKEQLSHFFGDVPFKQHNIKTKTVPEALQILDREFPIDLLVMIKHQRTFMERLLSSSVIHEIGFNSQFPFLVLPSEKYEPGES